MDDHRKKLLKKSAEIIRTRKQLVALNSAFKMFDKKINNIITNKSYLHHIILCGKALELECHNYNLRQNNNK